MKKNKTCRLVKAHLVDIAEKKKIPSLPEEILRAHLDSCPQCSRLIKDFSLLWNRIESPTEIEPSPYFLSRLINKIEEYEHQEAAPKKILTGLKPLLRAVPVTALILLGIITGIQLAYSPSKISQDKTSEFVSEYFNKFEEIPSDSLADAYLYLNTNNVAEEGRS